MITWNNLLNVSIPMSENIYYSEKKSTRWVNRLQFWSQGFFPDFLSDYLSS